MILALLCYNKRPSAVCQQKFRTALTINYLHGLNSFKIRIQYNYQSQKYRVSKKILPRLCGFCGGVVDSIILVLRQLHRLGFNLKFETLYESMWQMVADLWEIKDKISIKVLLVLKSGSAEGFGFSV